MKKNKAEIRISNIELNMDLFCLEFRDSEFGFVIWIL